MGQVLTSANYGAEDGAVRRRSDRILAPLRILVSGKNPSGVAFDEDALTVIINKHGAAISLAQVLYPEQRLRIRNLENGIEADFRVVGELRRVLGDRREWGVEEVGPGSGIWGVDFGQRPEGSQAKALIACMECRSALLTTISSTEYHVLLHTGLMSRHCERCGQTTRWKPSEQAAAAGELVAGSEPPPAAVEKRKHARRHLTMLLRVRDQSGRTESVQSVDASKDGISFVSKCAYHVGEEIWFTLPLTAGTAPKETKGRIVRRQSGPRGQLYAVSFSTADAEEVAEPERRASGFWAKLTGRGGGYGQR